MKTFVIGLIAIGLTNLINAQNDLASVSNSDDLIYSTKISSNTSKDFNMEYLSETNQEGVSIIIQKLQKVVANYNIKTSEVYQPELTTTYTVNFSEDENTVVAVYNKDGEVISSNEHYQNIRLPYKISLEIAKKYPGWAFNNVQCEIVYAINNSVETKYKINLKKNRKSKNIVISI